MYPLLDLLILLRMLMVDKTLIDPNDTLYSLLYIMLPNVSMRKQTF